MLTDNPGMNINGKTALQSLFHIKILDWQEKDFTTFLNIYKV